MKIGWGVSLVIDFVNKWKKVLFESSQNRYYLFESTFFTWF